MSGLLQDLLSSFDHITVDVHLHIAETTMLQLLSPGYLVSSFNCIMLIFIQFILGSPFRFVHSLLSVSGFPVFFIGKLHENGDVGRGWRTRNGKTMIFVANIRRFILVGFSWCLHISLTDGM